MENLKQLKIHRFEKGRVVPFQDLLGSETQLSLFLNHDFIASIHCTATDLEELILGFLFSKGFISSVSEIEILEHDDNSSINVFLSPNAGGHVPVIPKQPGVTDYNLLLEKFIEFSGASPLFRATGSVHSGQLMDASLNSLFFTEDMGRHNVIDKIIGFALKNKVDLEECTLMISSRMPLELFEKCNFAGIHKIASISAPTYEGIEFARAHNITVAGMFRDKRFNIY